MIAALFGYLPLQGVVCQMGAIFTTIVYSIAVRCVLPPKIWMSRVMETSCHLPYYLTMVD